MDLNDIPLLKEKVDTSRYEAADRKIRHIFKGASIELVAMVINFAHSRELGVPGDHNRGWEKRKAALDNLLYGGYVELLYGHWHDKAGKNGRCRIYRCTNLFDKMFSFRLPLRLVVAPSYLSKAGEQPPLSHDRIKVNSIATFSSGGGSWDSCRLAARRPLVQIQPPLPK
jgi:hypothetical protein